MSIQRHAADCIQLLVLGGVRGVGVMFITSILDTYTKYSYSRKVIIILKQTYFILKKLIGP